MADEIQLGGGYVNDVVRVGDTVRRRLKKPRPFAQQVLQFLEAKAWSGAPRFLGFDDEGREVLSWIDGHVPWVGVDEPASVWSESSIARVAALTREFHDLTAGSKLAGSAEVVCHYDLAPRNTVYRSTGLDRDVLVPIAFVDWDLAAPGPRVHDLAHVCWQWAVGVTSPLDAACRLLRVAADTYDCAPSDREELVDTILRLQDRCWRGIQAGIDSGDPAFERLEAAGAVPGVQADWEWTKMHRDVLVNALVGDPT